MQPLRAGLLGVGFALAMAGCTSDVPQPSVAGFQAVVEGAPSTIGNGDFPLTLRLMSEDSPGPPIAGAPVLVFPIEKPYSPPGINELRAGKATWAARTDEQGEVHARLEAGKTYTFLATAPGHTVEARHLIKLDRERRDAPLDLVLFSESKTVKISGALPASTRVSRVGNIDFAPASTFWQTVEFHPTQQAQYVFRLAGLDAHLRWTNTPSEFADLSLRAGFSQNEYWESDRSSDLPGQGPMEETLALTPEDLAQGKPAKRLLMGPATGLPVVTADDLPFEIELEARFSTDAVEAGEGKSPRRTPGVGLVPVLGSIGLLVYVFRRPN
ncbi:MAG: hypothetical protein HYT80_06765 [Euryarchaeota archaeon]|nr:hypothetical protein [Euryarchaeota archaeon]